RERVIRTLKVVLLVVGVGEPVERGVNALVRGVLRDELVEGRGRLRPPLHVYHAARLVERARGGVGVSGRLDEAVKQLAALRVGARRGHCEGERGGGECERREARESGRIFTSIGV